MYEKLLLTNGGGVTGENQKGRQAGNRVNIIIGLGGTGKFCTRMIKTYAYQRLQLEPYDTNGVFQRIRFFAIDTDIREEDQEKDSNLMSFSTDEFIDIKTSNLVGAMAMDNWNDWWKGNDIAGVGDGAGGERRLGRLYLSYNAGAILSKIEGFYQTATNGIDMATANINFHVISGMGGGTGSGTFIDMCNILRKKYNNANVIGYFFLPEVNEDVVTAADTKNYIRQNGFAAMQDLDYVMQLGTNHGSFTQEYKGIQPVRWDEAPVQMCHIISNQGAVGLGEGKSKYNYAMNVAAEYIMDFLVSSNNLQHDLISEINNKNARVNGQEGARNSGYYCGYSSMGSSCSIVPYREINTYVISCLFDKFSQIFNNNNHATPDAKDCFGILKRAFRSDAATLGDINSAIYQKVAIGVNPGVYEKYPDSLTDINWNDIVTDEAELKRMRCSIIVPHALHGWYYMRYCNKYGTIRTNVESLSTSANTNSLIGLIKAQLDLMTQDINCGPSFARKTIDAAKESSLKNHVVGLIEANRTMYNNAYNSLNLRAVEYNEAVTKIQNKRANRKRVEAAEHAFISFLNQLSTVELFEGIIDALNTLNDQLKSAENEYGRLENVYNELKARFASNLNAIQGGNSTVVDTSYAEYLISIDQLKSNLDSEVNRAVPNIPNTFRAFIQWITAPAKRELLHPEHEDEFIKYINEFFVDNDTGLFNGLVQMTIDDYLKMAFASGNRITDWHTVTNAQIQGYVYGRMRNLMERAKPLFNLNIGIQSNLGSATGWITIPDGSAAIRAAATQAVAGSNLQINGSALSDRIFIEMRHDGVSISALSRVSKMEDTADQSADRHLYSGYPNLEGVFKDWSKLPPLTPYQLWNKSNRAFTNVDSDAATFDNAVDCNLIVPVSNGNIDDDYSQGIVIKEFDFDAINALRIDIDAFEKRINNLTSARFVADKDDIIVEADALKDRLSGLFTKGFTIKNNFSIETIDRVKDPSGVKHRKAFYKDMFVRDPQLVMNIKNQLSQKSDYLNVLDRVANCTKIIENKITVIEEENRKLPVFENALFTGLFTIVGNKITCSCCEDNTQRELIPDPLSDTANREAFPYCDIPIYQAFLTFMKLDADTINSIAKIADKKANEMFNPGSAIDESVANFMNRSGVWYQIAADKIDNDKLKVFLNKECNQFSIFKQERGLN